MKLGAREPKGFSSESLLAAMSVRLMLDFEPKRIAAIDKESLMVAGHLRVVNVIPSHREYMFSSTPSEPIVAEAAAQVLHGKNMIELLSKNVVKDGLIEKGQRGELAARLLLTLARDAAWDITTIGRVVPTAHRGQIDRLFTAPVPLLEFLSRLFARSHFESIMGATPDNQTTGPTIRESFKDAYVMFTHFGKAADDWCISDEFAFMALTRNMAIACRERMKFVDLCIPIHFGREERLSRYNTSAIFISIKDKAKAMGYNHTHIDVGKMKFFTDETKQRPVINLILQLGVQSAGRHIVIKRTETQQTPGLLATPKRKGRGGKETPQTPSGMSMLREEYRDKPKTRAEGVTPGPAYYTINATGCSSEIYGVVKPEEESLWHGLLASKDFLSEHSRQETPYLNAVLAQKPIWTRGPECCSWANLSELPSQSDLQEAGEVTARDVAAGIFFGTDRDDADVFK